MALNASMIYRRTDRGVREVYEKSHQFTQSERLILILLDGRLNVAGLQARLPSLNDERIERALRKLQDAVLIEPMGSYDAIKASGMLPEAMRLEPDAVAHFLEQTDLDPITVFGDSDEAVATELVRASVEQAAAQLAREVEAERTTGRSPREAEPPPVREAEQRRRRAESGRSHDARLSRARPSTEAQWDGASTHFAITTVNVPDRLDLQEERDRADLEDYADERRRIDLRIWLKRLLVFAVIAVIGAGLYGMLKPLRDETSATRIGERLSAAFKQPINVADTEFRISPAPRLIIRGIEAPGKFKADEVSLLMNWRDLWGALRGGQWVWGEATIAPLTLTPPQAVALARALPVGVHDLPSKISTIRFESVRIADSRIFPGRYEGLMRRAEAGKFGPLTLRQLDADGAAMQFQLRGGRMPDGRDTTEFRLEAERWMPPFGPRVRWNEARAEGRIYDNVIEVSEFTLAGFFGMTSGLLYAASDVEWVITGVIGASNIDVESVLQTLRPEGQNNNNSNETPTALQGIATMSLTVVGRGESLDDAISRAAIAGPFQIRWCTLNGINLGLAATQGATAAGITRFTDFDGLVAASAYGVRFEDTGGRAGALAARGDFAVATDLAVAGAVRVELGGQKVQAPINLRIRGSALAPRFGQ
jgi:hypothetical protein